MFNHALFFCAKWRVMFGITPDTGDIGKDIAIPIHDTMLEFEEDASWGSVATLIRNPFNRSTEC